MKQSNKPVSAFKILKVVALMFYYEQKLSFIVTMVIFISIVYIKKIQLDSKILGNIILQTKEGSKFESQALKLFCLEIAGSFLQEFKHYIFADIFGNQIRLVSMKSYQYLLTDESADRNNGIIQNNINIGNESAAKLLSVVILNILPCIIAIIFLIQKFYSKFAIWFTVIVIMSYFVCGYVHFKIMILRLSHKEILNRSIGFGNKAIHETIVNYENIRTRNMEDHEIKKYEQIIKTYEKNIVKYKKYGYILSFIHRGIFSLLKYSAYMWYVKNYKLETYLEISVLKTLVESS